MGGPIVAGAAAAAGFLAWAVRGRSSPVFGPSIWRGPSNRRAVALTFDDGPGDSTPALLEILDRHRVSATFFMCGAHVRRLPSVAREIAAAGHEVGNHTDTHARLWLRSGSFIADELRQAQETISETVGARPRWFRPTYGVRWFGLQAAQQALGLTTVMWTTIGQDWKLKGPAVARRLTTGARRGAIFCLHDGRERDPAAGIESTLDAVSDAIPRLLDSGWHFETVSGLLGYSNPICPPTSSSE